MSLCRLRVDRRDILKWLTEDFIVQEDGEFT